MEKVFEISSLKLALIIQIGKKVEALGLLRAGYILQWMDHEKKSDRFLRVSEMTMREVRGHEPATCPPTPSFWGHSVFGLDNQSAAYKFMHLT